MKAKRYLVLTGSQYYPSGATDIKNSYDTLAEAVACCQGWLQESCRYANIFDLEEFKEIEIESLKNG
jgi:hypothetical protein